MHESGNTEYITMISYIKLVTTIYVYGTPCGNKCSSNQIINLGSLWLTMTNHDYLEQNIRL